MRYTLYVTHPVETRLRLGFSFFNRDVVDMEFCLDNDDGTWTEVFCNVVGRYELAFNVCYVVLQQCHLDVTI